MSRPVILCVDDEQIILKSLKNQLQIMFGDEYLYEIAENVPDALEIIEEMEEDGHRVQIVISDLMMPGIRGDDFMVQLQQERPSIKKIMLTGHMDENSLRRVTQEAKLRFWIKKPWTQQQLFTALRD